MSASVTTNALSAPSSSNRSSERMHAAAIAAARRSRGFQRPLGSDNDPLKISEYFGCNTFSFELMEKKLRSLEVSRLKEYATSGESLPRDLADLVANAVKEWAVSKGATHYCHWFQPQTGATAEKHDSFFSFDSKGGAVERFTGKELIQSEPDASSFPSGGRRSTFEARGYTVWDASSPMFLMQTEQGMTLCIPSLFISYSGEALDQKTPLLKSLSALNRRACEALHLLGHDDVKYCVATAGPEQEYFVVDDSLGALRPDLVLAGRTLLGRNPPRGQQLEDHYFGSIKPRVLSFMMECEQELYKLGVPCKTRHNEVAPNQCEIAPIFEFANVAADHNQLVMEVLKSVGKRHHLTVLFHEKPFAGINGSGKHVNWAIADSNGHNMLEPGDNPSDNIRFLYFLAATIKAIHDHGAMMRMAIASAGNDFRLGANEAPPAIMSVFLGETLDEVLNKLTDGRGGALTERQREINLDLARVPVISRDNTDRNRTSPFAFTGNKFEFRAVGSSASISPSLTFLNAAAADALEVMNAELRRRGGDRPSAEHILALIQETVKATKKIRFEGNGYSNEWHQEAESRGLPNLRTTPEALKVLNQKSTQDMLERLGILGKEESSARYNVFVERYNKIRLIELETLLEMVSTQVLPAVESQISQQSAAVEACTRILAKTPKAVASRLEGLVNLYGNLVEETGQLQALLGTTSSIHDEEKLAAKLAGDGMAMMEKVRKVSDELELLVDDSLWSLPKYRELLYIL
jgi:glutamine synthetase